LPPTTARTEGPFPARGIESNPLILQVRQLLGAGEYASAVRLAYRSAFDHAVRTYGLVVPPSLTDRGFLRRSLQSDMGPLPDLLPKLYQLYEPVRFGTFQGGDAAALEALLRSLYTDTVLARIYDPRFQPSGPDDRAPARATYSVVGPAPVPGREIP